MKDPSPSALVSCRHEAANPRFGFRLSDLASSFLLLVAMPGAPSSDALVPSSFLFPFGFSLVFVPCTLSFTVASCYW